MIEFNCAIQEGRIPDSIRAELVSELTRVSASVMGASPDDVDVQFTEIPNGFGFRGGELSTTSLVRGQIPPGCEQELRVEFMRRICDVWCRVTGCATDELVVSARDRQ